MAEPEWIALLALQATCVVASLHLARRAWLGRRLAPARPLAWFLGAFVAVAAAHALAMVLDLVVAASPVLFTRRWDVLDALFWGYYATSIVAAGLLLATFDRRKLRLALAFGPVLLVAGPLLQVLLIALWVLVSIHAGLNHIERATVASRWTAAGYFLILLGQFLHLWDYDPLTPQNLGGVAATAAGLAALAWATRAANRGPA